MRWCSVASSQIREKWFCSPRNTFVSATSTSLLYAAAAAALDFPRPCSALMLPVSSATEALTTSDRAAAWVRNSSDVRCSGRERL